ncbi:hypothetical protein PHJA_001102200 [Phtheirospermum japonicum]|uniref:Uncharacterized protein n=1 Tax=Phtheirospermum japonicum TaxID=374723 RepID=A0A830C2H0_9LAMI|nr:hypothetical protein PHJA_001102200 [Phtheirospermum japonicum]
MKSVMEVERHYAVLLDDVVAIEVGLIEFPAYAAAEDGLRSLEPQKNSIFEQIRLFVYSFANWFEALRVYVWRRYLMLMMIIICLFGYMSF